MSSTWSSIHVSWTNGSVWGSSIDLLLNLIVACHRNLAHALNEDTEFRMFTHIEATFGAIIRFDKEILNALVVDLDHTECDCMLNIVLRVINSFIYPSEHLLTCSRYDTFVSTVPHNRITFPRTCLSIGKQASMISLECIIQYFLTLLKIAQMISITAIPDLGKPCLGQSSLNLESASYNR